MSNLEYLDQRQIIGAEQIDPTPRQIAGSVTGYGRKLATGYKIRLRSSNRIQRVYVVNYGNAGSPFVVIAGDRVFLDHACEYRLHTLEAYGVSIVWQSLDSFTRQYIETAMWSSYDETDDAGGDPIDKNFGIEDVAQSFLADAICDCQRFQTIARELLEKAYASEIYVAGEAYNESNAGHDFWLTRNGHGSGFWDRGFPDEIGEGLASIAQDFVARNMYIYNKKVYCE